MLSPQLREQHEQGCLSILLYADDTLLIGSSEPGLQELLNSIASVGLRYGMELHWQKFQLLEVNAKYTVLTPGGEQIQPSQFMTYLGANIYADGCIRSELNQKLGVAWADFSKLHRLWNHSTLTAVRKTQIFQAIVASRLLYGLSSAWLNVAEIRRLNGFQARCLRKIVGVKPAFVSRISNAAVLERAGQVPFGRQLLKQQLLLYGRVARSPDSDVLRQLTFAPGTLQAATSRYIRRVGRPRNEWAIMLQKEAWKVSQQADTLVNNQWLWREAVSQYFNV